MKDDLEENVSHGAYESMWIYAIWSINIESDGEYDFSQYTSWDTRIILDGKIIHSWDGRATIKLSKGTYILELEHINTFWFLDILVNYGAAVDEYTIEELSEIIEVQDKEIWYVWRSESYSEGHISELDITKSSQEVSLMLFADSPVNWVINNPYKTRIREIVMYSWEYGSTVTGRTIEDVPVYYLKQSYDIPVIYDIVPDCDDTGGYFYCDSDIDEVDDLNDVVEEIFWNKLTGFTWEYLDEVYDEDKMFVPVLILDEAWYQKIADNQQKLRDLEKKSEEEKDFNNIFD